MDYKVGDVVTYPVHVFMSVGDGMLRTEPGYMVAEIVSIDATHAVVWNLYDGMMIGLRLEALSAQHPL